MVTWIGLTGGRANSEEGLWGGAYRGEGVVMSKNRRAGTGSREGCVPLAASNLESPRRVLGLP